MKRDHYGKLSESYWIGGENGANPMTAEQYTFSCGYQLKEGGIAGIAAAARNKDNYLLIAIDHTEQRLRLYDVCDNAWENKGPSRRICGSGEGYPVHVCGGINEIEIQVCYDTISIRLNGREAVSNERILPQNHWVAPPKNMLMLVGAEQRKGCIVLYHPAAVIDGLLFRAAGIHPLEIRDGFELFSVVPCVNVRRRINIKKKISSGVLYSSARGFYNVYVNGVKAGDEYFAPGFTDYRLRIQYNKYDITDMLRSGENIVRAVVGQGYYSGYAGYNRLGNIYGTRNSFIGRIELEYADGTTETFVTDGSWEFSSCGPVLYADYLQGEYYDARLESVSDSWEPCGIVPDPEPPLPSNGTAEGLQFTMDEQEYRGAHAVMRLAGSYVGEAPKGHKIYDLGQNMAGTVKIKLKGRRGDSVKIRYGEMLRKNGSLYLSNLRSAANTDIYILKGSPEGEVFSPDLTSHGFRYVEITEHGGGLNQSAVEVLRVTGIVLSNVDRITGSFECSDELINRLFSNILWGQRGNCLLVPTDCPQRNERMGWTGDMQVFVRTAAYNMDIYEFARKWLRDLREAQLMFNRGGSVPDIAPLCGDNRGGCGGWADAAVIVPYELYRAYGDQTVLEENYEMMKAWVDYQNSPERLNNGLRFVDDAAVPERSDLARTPYIQPQQRRGDHLALDESTPFILCATAYAAYCAELLSEIAGILGKSDDAEKYAGLHRKIKKAFNEAWIQPDGTIAYWGEMSRKKINRTRYSDEPGSVCHPSQTAYALAIDFGLIDVKQYPRAAQCFRNTIKENDGKLSVGFLGISHLLPALMKCGYSGDAFRLFEQKGNPGWLYSVLNGATTIWERWDSYIAETDTFGEVSMNSFNHYAYGAVGEWLFGYVLGIMPQEAGYRKFTLKPHYGGSLTAAKGSYLTAFGRIKSGWQTDKGAFVYRCTVPPGTSACLTLPDGSRHELKEGAYTFSVPVGRDVEC